MADYQFDRLKMYFGKPFEVGNGMHINIPSIGDILELPNSDATFYQTLNIWVCNTTSYRLPLWDMGIDWNKISDYELFTQLIHSGNKQVEQMLFGDIDFETFLPYSKTIIVKDENGEDVEKVVPTLYSAENDIEISEEDYLLMSAYFKAGFNIYPKVEKAKGRLTKESIIEEDRMNLAIKARNGENEPTSYLLPLVSSVVNHPGFKYNLEELEHVNFVFFMDAVQRLQIYENSTAMLKGAYGGFVDASKLPKDELNFMRDLKPTK